MKKTILVSIITMISLSMFGQDTPQKLIDSFFNEFATSPRNAISNLYASSIWFSNSPQLLEKIEPSLNRCDPALVGTYCGYTLIAKKQVGQCFLLYSYILKYDREPTLLTLEFYKPNDTWRIYYISLDSNIDDEIESAAKLYNLDLDGDK